jgi:quercetin dioxygenase-like cupin family protein
VPEGTLEYAIDGIGTRAYKAGEALTVPAYTVHPVGNSGSSARR